MKLLWEKSVNQQFKYLKKLELDYVRFLLHVIERTQDGGWCRVCTRKHQTNQPTTQILLTPQGLNKGYDSLPNEYNIDNTTFQ